jgi:hypothetical protein
MSFQIPPLQRQTSEPVLSVEGMTWDLSNLCSTQNNSYSFPPPPNRRLDRTQSYRHQRRREQALYPSKSALGRSLPDDINTSDIFDRSRSQPPSSGNRQRTQSLPSGAKEFDDQQKHSISDYYRLDSKTTTSSTRSIICPKPNSPPRRRTHVDQTKYDRYSQPLPRNPAHDPDDEFSDHRYNESQERGDSRYCSHYDIPQDPPPSPGFISDCSSDVSSQRRSCSSRRSLERERTPLQVEVYPGEFLHLRGAKETVEAIERGYSKSVFCYACGLGLRCVADCDLVVCPDCRFISPVPCRPASLFEDAECEEDDTSYRYRASPLPQFNPLWRDDNDSFHASRPPHEESNTRSPNRRIFESTSTGGVGLGLRIE